MFYSVSLAVCVVFVFSCVPLSSVLFASVLVFQQDVLVFYCDQLF